MTINRIILIETSSPGNLGAALRVAANFGVETMALVRPKVGLEDPIVGQWACGARQFVDVRVFPTLDEAAAEVNTLVATASGRGRPDHPIVGPMEAIARVAGRGTDDAALVFGSETRGMSKSDLDRCDLAVQIPTHGNFPVLNLTQAIAILLSHFAIAHHRPTAEQPKPAPHRTVEALMTHMKSTLANIGYLDPVNPNRILRKIRAVFGRAGITDNEAAIFRGICRQMDWAVGNLNHDESGRPPGRFNQLSTNQDDEQPGGA